MCSKNSQSAKQDCFYLKLDHFWQNCTVNMGQKQEKCRVRDEISSITAEDFVPEVQVLCMTGQVQGQEQLGMQKVRVRDGFQVQDCLILLLKVPISEPDQFAFLFLNLNFSFKFSVSLSLYLSLYLKFRNKKFCSN